MGETDIKQIDTHSPSHIVTGALQGKCRVFSERKRGSHLDWVITEGSVAEGV